MIFEVNFVFVCQLDSTPRAKGGMVAVAGIELRVRGLRIVFELDTRGILDGGERLGAVCDFGEADRR